ncbi:hypothetical protein [Pseudomonas veronii]|uniref:hypothetical protein n=1 Tax=Pseudomonas veronii TaxID=76761 RepID=UPI002657D4DE|nr:hypothetical protein [Pseudomonas veronii]WKC46146.1 hypothetical protein QYP03_25505 [Pseudomonas veronii]
MLFTTSNGALACVEYAGSVGEISRILLDLLLKPPAANLLKPLPIQRPEVEVRIAKGVLTPVTIWSFAHAQQHAQSLY